MRKLILSLFLLFSFSLFGPIGGKEGDTEAEKKSQLEDESQSLYAQIELNGLIPFDAFKSAYTGYKKLNKGNNPLLTLIDFSRPSTEKRMYVMDLSKKRSFLFRTYHTAVTVGEIMPHRSPTATVPTKAHWDSTAPSILMTAEMVILSGWMDWKKESTIKPCSEPSSYTVLTIAAKT